MKKQIRFLRCESGAELIEAALIYPLVLLIIGGLIYFGLFILQYTTVSAYAQKMALIAAREVAYPGYVGLISQEKLGSAAVEVELEDYSQPASSVENAQNGTVINIEMSMNALDNGFRAYRYWSPDPLGLTEKSEKKTVLTEIMRSMIDNNSIMLGKQAADVEIKCQNMIITQYVTVEVKQDLMNNQLMKALGYEDPIIHVKATATVSDTDEFIRNTDFICDTVEMLAKKVGIDVKAVRDKVNEVKELLGLD